MFRYGLVGGACGGGKRVMDDDAAADSGSTGRPR